MMQKGCQTITLGEDESICILAIEAAHSIAVKEKMETSFVLDDSEAIEEEACS